MQTSILPPILQDREIKLVKKKTVLLQQGNNANYSYYVVKGCLKSYLIDDNGKEHIIQFAPEGWFIGDMNSMLNNVEAMININAIEDTELILLEKRSPTDMLLLLPPQELQSMIKILQNNIIALNKRLIHLLSSTAEQRYIDFINTYPSLIQRLPLKMIASYIGVTPEFLSRIRKKIAGKYV